MQLNKTQIKYRNIFLEKLARRIYKVRKIKCPCGSVDDVKLFSKDKFGILLSVVLCKKCGIVRCDPYYTKNTLRDFYNLEYRGLYGGDDYNLKKLFEKQLRTGNFFSNYLQKHYFKVPIKNKVIYEIGCSMGGTLLFFKKLGNYVAGCDYDSRHINYGAKKDLNLFHGDFNNLFKLGKKADVIIMSHVLEHLGDPVFVLTKIRKMLKKNGVLFIAVPGIYFIHRSSRGILGRYIQNAHAFYYTKKSLESLLNLCDYKMVYGDESVFGIFSKGGIPKVKVREDYRDIIKYLDKIKIFGRLYYYSFMVCAKALYFMRKLGILSFTLKTYHYLFDRFKKQGV